MTGAAISGLTGPGLVETCLTLDRLPGNRMPLVENFRNDPYHLPGRMPFRGEKYDHEGDMSAGLPARVALLDNLGVRSEWRSDALPAPSAPAHIGFMKTSKEN